MAFFPSTYSGVKYLTEQRHPSVAPGPRFGAGRGRRQCAYRATPFAGRSLAPAVRYIDHKRGGVAGKPQS